MQVDLAKPIFICSHAASPLLGQRVENKDWFAKNNQLKEAGQS